MRKIAVPVTSRILGREDITKIVRQLRELNAEYVFIGIGSPKTDDEKRKAELELLKEKCACLEKEGFKTTIWLWSFLVPEDKGYQRIISLEGEPSPQEVCPLDENYVEFYSGYLKDLAQYVKPHMILFDDDYGFGNLVAVGIGCACPKHLKMMSDILGEDVELEGIGKKIFAGKANKYRNAYTKAMKKTLIGFADKVRSEVDSVNPDVRLGVCSLMSAWNTDGVSSYEIAKHLAGKHRPFVRLIGAPYWGVNKSFGNNRLQDVINLQRIEASWNDGDTEVLYEGDVFPRPRFTTPANFLEIFDMALLAGGTADSILKYAIDFNSYDGYEYGYIKRHKKNRSIYEWIEKNMKGKADDGVRVYEYMHTVQTAELPETYEDFQHIQDRFMSPASKMMSACSVPVTYFGKGSCGVVFGENARYLTEDERKSGLIIDIGAAKVLSELGIDVGIEEWGEVFSPFEEYYHTEDVYVWMRDVTARKVKVNKNADIQSSFTFASGNEKFPASYFYENSDGYKFLVLAFDGYRAGGCPTDVYKGGESVFRQYARSRQLQSASEFLTGEKLSIKIDGNPDLYTIVKKDGDSLAVGMWNIFPDSVLDPVIKLKAEFSKIETCNCKAELDGDTVKLSDIAPYGFAGFKVYK